MTGRLAALQGLCSYARKKIAQCQVAAPTYEKKILEMLDGRAQEDLNVVTIAGLTLDHQPELWALLMAARVCIDESPGPIQPDWFIDATCNYPKVKLPLDAVSFKVKRYRIACHCARRGRYWAGLSVRML
jgi:hypothetical protein